MKEDQILWDEVDKTFAKMDEVFVQADKVFALVPEGETIMVDKRGLWSRICRIFKQTN